MSSSKTLFLFCIVILQSLFLYSSSEEKYDETTSEHSIDPLTNEILDSNERFMLWSKQQGKSYSDNKNKIDSSSPSNLEKESNSLEETKPEIYQPDSLETLCLQTIIQNCIKEFEENINSNVTSCPYTEHIEKFMQNHSHLEKEFTNLVDEARNFLEDLIDTAIQYNKCYFIKNKNDLKKIQMYTDRLSNNPSIEELLIFKKKLNDQVKYKILNLQKKYKIY